MAKVVGLVGGLRGKLGNTVFMVSGGQQVARVYQPVVFNPNSALQIAQRAKMALVGRLSKITPSVVMEGLPGYNRRARRGAFVAEGIKASTYSNNKASLVYSYLKLSRGNIQFSIIPSFTAENLDASTIRLTVNLAVYGSDPLPSGAGFRTVVYLIDNTNSDRDTCSTRIVPTPTVGNPTSASFLFRLTRGTAANYTPVVYIIPFRSTEQLDGVSYSFVGSETDTFIVVDGLRSVAKLEFGDSLYVAPSA